MAAEAPAPAPAVAAPALQPDPGPAVAETLTADPGDAAPADDPAKPKKKGWWSLGR